MTRILYFQAKLLQLFYFRIVYFDNLTQSRASARLLEKKKKEGKKIYEVVENQFETTK